MGGRSTVQKFNRRCEGEGTEGMRSRSAVHQGEVRVGRWGRADISSMAAVRQNTILEEDHLPLKRDGRKVPSLGGRMGRGRKVTGGWLLFGACLVLLMGRGDAQGNRTTPYIAGVWEMEYTYSELLGPLDNQIVNPCRGPFPYRYKWKSYIWQETEDVNGTMRTTGNIRWCRYEMEECQSKARKMEIVLGSVRIVTSKCAFQPKDEHANDFRQYPGYFIGGYVKELFPTDKYNKPVTKKLWSRFQVPKEAPYAYGIFCEQFAWQDRSSDTKISPPYDGAWRYDNESWVFVRDISTCPCFPVCAECEEKLAGTSIKQVKEDGGECLARYGNTPQQCQYIIVGVGGGPAVFPQQTTSFEPDDFGDPQVCFSYATIKGKRLKPASDLPVVRSAEWGKIGIPSENPAPPDA